MSIEQSKDRSIVFGRKMSQLELLMNSIIFMIIEVGYWVYNVGNQLPEGWRESGLGEDFDIPLIIPVILFIISLNFFERFFYVRYCDKYPKDRKKHFIIQKYILFFVIFLINWNVKFLLLVNLF